MKKSLLLVIFVSAALTLLELGSAQAEWYRGNLHMHTQWSDGKSMPEYAVAWYKERGYNFIVTSDHNTFQSDKLRFDDWSFSSGDVNKDDFAGETSRWKPVEKAGWPKLSQDCVDAAAEKFGAGELVKKESGGRTFYRLKTFDELSAQFNESGKFLIIPGFESTGRAADGHEVHMNCINVRDYFPYIETPNPETTIRETLAKANEMYANNSQPWIFTANHPLWRFYDFSPEDLIANPNVKFFELNNNGATFPLHEQGWTPEKFWDAVNAFRCVRGDQLLYATGSDDSHSNPPNEKMGRGWTVVRADQLDASSLINAINAGDYYTSNGLDFADIAFDRAAGTLSVTVAAAEGETYRIDFIGTKKNFDRTVTPVDSPAKDKQPQRTIHVYSDDIGVVLQSTVGTQSSYTLADDDLYVRARVTLKSPAEKSEILRNKLSKPAAWTQPYRKEAAVNAPKAAANESAVPFEVGVAATDITPPMDFPISGYYHERLSTGVIDPLLAKALVFRQGDRQAALVVCDVIELWAVQTDAARDQASAATGIPRENIIVTATHTHTGPFFGEKSKEYEKTMIGQIAAAIVEAQKNLRSATIESGDIEVNDLAFNRRFIMKEGPAVFNPGFNNPNIVRPAAGIDPVCNIVLFRDADGKPFASLTNFALHLDTTGGTEFSGDYPRYLADVLREKFGDQFISVFGTGTCGDINHFDFAGNTPRKRASEIGTQLGSRLAERIDAGLTPEKPSLAAAEKIVMVPRQTFTDEQVAAAKADAETVFDDEAAKAKNKSFLERVEIGKILDLSTRPLEVKLDTQAIRLSDKLAVSTIPGEVFVDLGLAIKSGSPFARTLVVELSQDTLCYVPTEKAFGEGSYETVNSVVTVGGGEKLVETALDALDAVKP